MKEDTPPVAKAAALLYRNPGGKILSDYEFWLVPTLWLAHYLLLAAPFPLITIR